MQPHAVLSWWAVQRRSKTVNACIVQGIRVSPKIRRSILTGNLRKFKFADFASLVRCRLI